MEELYLGSHVSMSAPDYVLGSVEEALSYEANAFMLYTGAPQNTKRKPLDILKIDQAHDLMKRQGLKTEHLIVHAPYIINLANTIKPETYEIAVTVLKQEIERTKALGAKFLVLHPGSHVKMGIEAGLESIVKGLDEAMDNMGDVCIALETMAGKGSEIGRSFEELEYIRSHVHDNKHIKVCLDTCHIHDAGYDVTHFDEVLDEFDTILGLENLAVLHINDSKNPRGSHKDRHANIGQGQIGFDALNAVVHHPRLKSIVKILETPYVEGNPPYKYEIAMLRNGTFDENILNKIKVD